MSSVIPLRLTCRARSVADSESWHNASRLIEQLRVSHLFIPISRPASQTQATFLHVRLPDPPTEVLDRSILGYHQLCGPPCVQDKDNLCNKWHDSEPEAQQFCRIEDDQSSTDKCTAIIATDIMNQNPTPVAYMILSRPLDVLTLNKAARDVSLPVDENWTLL